jgi:hypothetical protein
MAQDNLNRHINKISKFTYFDHKKTPIIYHYCSTSTFLTIISKRTMRFSDINFMNDSAEMHWAHHKFIQSINIKDRRLEREFYDEVDTIIGRMQLINLPLVACFSQEGDILSQWRAYADDGAGVAIGFDAEAMTKLAGLAGRVVYDSEKQLDFFDSFLFIAYKMWKSKESIHNGETEFRNFVHLLAFNNCFIKNPAFSEEKEIRIVRATIVKRLDDHVWSLNDIGGESTDSLSSAQQKVEYRAHKNGGIVSFIDLPLAGLGCNLIKEVVLGPKSTNNGTEVSMALNSCGFSNFKIRHSLASYR